MMDVTYDNTTLTGWHKGFPDVLAKIDLGTHRNVPWGGGMPFFLGESRRGRTARRSRCRSARGRHAERVLKRAEKLGVMPMCGMEYEWFNFAETPQSWADKKGEGPTTITPGMFGYSLLRANANRDFFAALMGEMGDFGVPIEGLHTETGPGVYEAAILFSEALEAADRRSVQDRREGNRRALRDHAELHGEVEPASARLLGPHPPIDVGRQEEPLLRCEGQEQHEQAVRELPRRTGRRADGNGADVLADDQQLQAPGRRLLGAGQADVGHRQPDGELSRDRRLAQVHAPGDALPRRRHESVPRGRRGARGGPIRDREKLKLTAKPIHGTNQGAENIPRAPRTLIETTRIFRDSDLARDWFGDDFVDHYAATREWEWRQWLDAVTDWEMKRYFEII